MRIEIKRIVIKMSMFSIPTMKMLKEFFPEANFLFITRAPQASLISAVKVMKSLPFIVNNFKIYSMFWYQHMPLPYEKENLQAKLKHYIKGGFVFSTTLEYLTISYLGSILCFLQDSEIYDKLIFYEDLITSTEAETEAMFKATGCPIASVPDAVSALDRHSQGNLFSLGEKEKNFDHISKDEWGGVQRKFDEYGFGFQASSEFTEFKQSVKDAIANK